MSLVEGEGESKERGRRSRLALRQFRLIAGPVDRDCVLPRDGANLRPLWASNLALFASSLPQPPELTRPREPSTYRAQALRRTTRSLRCTPLGRKP